MPSQNDWPAALEILDADALLLDPGVVAEVEDRRRGLVGQLDHVVVAMPSGSEPNISPALTSSNEPPEMLASR